MSNAQAFSLSAGSDVSLRDFAAEAARCGLVFQPRIPRRRDTIVVDVTNLETSLANIETPGFDVAGDPEALERFSRIAQSLGALN